jgi:hypothetical protein
MQASVRRMLEAESSTSWESAWSPDGRRIAFYSDRTGRFELYIMNRNRRISGCKKENRVESLVSQLGDENENEAGQKC